MNPTSPDGELLLLVHGTGAARPFATGDAWWQLGSEFATAVAEQTGLALPAIPEVFHWSGANSELQRRAAGDALLLRLRELERQGRGYHLVGHSHGGSVIWAALRKAEAGRPLAGLRSWTTVGTPFFHFAPRLRSWWQFLPGAVAALVIAAAADDVPEFRAHWREVLAENGALATAAMAVLFAAVLLVVLFQAFTLARGAIEHVLARRDEARERRAWSRHAERYLCIWSTEDEAIGGLKHSPTINLTVLPRLTASSGWWADPPVRWVVHPFLWLYNHVVGDAGDQFVSARLMGGAQGNDLWSSALTRVGVTPLGTPAPPLEPEIDRDLIDTANAAAGITLGRLRKTFAETAATGGVSALVTGAQEVFAWRELIHTSYFEHPAVLAAIVGHLRRWSGPRATRGGRPGPAAPSAAGTVSREARLPRRSFRARDSVAVALVSALVLLAGVAMTTLFASVYRPYTDDFQAETILGQARFSHATPADSVYSVGHESADHAYLRALAGTGRDTTLVFAEIERMDEPRRAAALAAYGSGYFLRGDTASAYAYWQGAVDLAYSRIRTRVFRTYIEGNRRVDSPEKAEEWDRLLRVLSEIERSGGHSFARRHVRELVRLYWASGAINMANPDGTVPVNHTNLPRLADIVLSTVGAANAFQVLRNPNPGERIAEHLLAAHLFRARLRRDGAEPLLGNAGMPLDSVFVTPGSRAQWAAAALARARSARPWARALRLALAIDPGCPPTATDPDAPERLSACYEVALAALDADSIGALAAAADSLGIADEIGAFALADSLAKVPGVMELAGMELRDEPLPNDGASRVLADDTHPARDLLFRLLALRTRTESYVSAIRSSRLERNALGALAVDHARRGRPADAVRVTLEMERSRGMVNGIPFFDPYPVERALYARIAGAAVARGDGPALRREVEEQILGTELRSRALIELAGAFARAGQLRAARLTVDENRSLDEDEVLRVYAQILGAYAKSR